MQYFTCWSLFSRNSQTLKCKKKKRQKSLLKFDRSNEYPNHAIFKSTNSCPHKAYFRTVILCDICFHELFYTIAYVNMRISLALIVFCTIGRVMLHELLNHQQGVLSSQSGEIKSRCVNVLQSVKCRLTYLNV